MAKNKVKIGDRISFQRNELNLEGIVEIVRDNSVIAAISSDDAILLGYETAKTVIKHSNYIVLKESATA